MSNDLISVVVPIYNVEKYLNRCLESIVAQTYTDLEIILVDDGSPDGCPQMCDDWATKDTRIKVIHKTNAGLGMARNTGIEAATGEYICFFDSDDHIEEDLIECAYEAAKERCADSVIFGYNVIGKDGKVKKQVIPKGIKYEFIGEEIPNIVLLEMIDPDPSDDRIDQISMSAWSKLYSMRSIEKSGWRFCSEREYSCEDLYSHLVWYSCIDKVAVVPKALYNYCENEGSLTKTYRKTAAKESEVCYDGMKRLCQELDYSSELIKRLGFWYFGSIIGICRSAFNSFPHYKECKMIYKEILYNEHFHSVMKKLDFKREHLKRRALFWIVKNKHYILFYWSMCFSIYFSRSISWIGLWREQ